MEPALEEVGQAVAGRLVEAENLLNKGKDGRSRHDLLGTLHLLLPDHVLLDIRPLNGLGSSLAQVENDNRCQCEAVRASDESDDEEMESE